jgi:hypothetical protein
MNANNYYSPLILSEYLFDNINNIKEQKDNETNVNIYKNKNINPQFRYYKDDRDLNLTPAFVPKFTYKNKSLFPREKPSQTEHDEIGISTAYLDKHFGYTDYGYFKVANQSLPEANKHKTTPNNNLFELL